MKKFLLAIAVVISFISCSDYGKKITVAGTKGEVYYKGDSVTEADAKKTGEFLKPVFFTGDKAASVQLTKAADTYTIRFVYDKKVYDTLKGADDEFKFIAVKASKELFNGQKVNIALADNTFNDYKTIPYDDAFAKTMETQQQQP